MIIKRIWNRKAHDTVGAIYYQRWEGWFLLGFLPLYIRQVD